MKRFLCLVALASAIGCTPKLNEHFDFEVGLDSNPLKIVPAIRTAQTVKVDVHATGGPIDVFVYFEKNKEAAGKESYAKGGPNLIADKRSIESATFEVPVPAGETTIVDVRAATLKKAKVSLNLTN
jgi:hypothetical protein